MDDNAIDEAIKKWNLEFMIYKQLKEEGQYN
jgi:hypothetical protein